MDTKLRRFPDLYQDSVTVVYLVLDDLRCPAGIGLGSGLKLLILKLNFYAAVSLCLACSWQGKTAFLCFVGAGSCRDLSGSADIAPAGQFSAAVDGDRALRSHNDVPVFPAGRTGIVIVI